jgi:hypothetical protein
MHQVMPQAHTQQKCFSLTRSAIARQPLWENSADVLFGKNLLLLPLPLSCRV